MHAQYKLTLRCDIHACFMGFFLDMFGLEFKAVLSQCGFWWWSYLSCCHWGMLVTDPTPHPPPARAVSTGHVFFLPSQQWEGADQVWGAVHVVVAMTGQWAIKPQGYGFMSHLVLSKVKGQGCMTCLTFNFSTIWGKPWTRQSSLTIDHRFIHEKVLVSVKIMSLKRCRHLRSLRKTQSF